MHTPLCKHSFGEPEEFAEVALARGLKGIIVTCHNPIPDGYSADVRMGMDQFDQYVALVERATQTWKGRIDVRLGIECDYAPELEPWLEKCVAMAPFNHVLGSVHPQVREYKRRYFNGDAVAYQKLYFLHLAMAAESGFFDTLSHPDLVKIIEPSEWQLERLKVDISHALDRIAATGVAMELNTSGLMKSYPEINPGQWMLEEMCKRNIPVVIGADAHIPARTGDKYEQAMESLQSAGYTNVNVFLERKRTPVSIVDALASLKPVAVSAAVA